jgi:hypothetical protein
VTEDRVEGMGVYAGSLRATSSARPSPIAQGVSEMPRRRRNEPLCTANPASFANPSEKDIANPARAWSLGIGGVLIIQQAPLESLAILWTVDS